MYFRMVWVSKTPISAAKTAKKETNLLHFMFGIGLSILAGAEGLEPSALGFGDRCSTN